MCVCVLKLSMTRTSNSRWWVCVWVGGWVGGPVSHDLFLCSCAFLSFYPLALCLVSGQPVHQEAHKASSSSSSSSSFFFFFCIYFLSQSSVLPCLYPPPPPPPLFFLHTLLFLFLFSNSHHKGHALPLFSSCALPHLSIPFVSLLAV